MLQNVRITAIIVYELLRENQQGDKITPPTQITKLGQLIDISKDNNFYESFEQFGGAVATLQFLFNLATCSNYSITNYIKNPLFHFLKR